MAFFSIHGYTTVLWLESLKKGVSALLHNKKKIHSMLIHSSLQKNNSTEKTLCKTINLLTQCSWKSHKNKVARISIQRIRMGWVGIPFSKCLPLPAQPLCYARCGSFTYANTCSHWSHDQQILEPHSHNAVSKEYPRWLVESMHN